MCKVMAVVHYAGVVDNIAVVEGVIGWSADTHVWPMSVGVLGHMEIVLRRFVAAVS